MSRLLFVAAIVCAAVPSAQAAYFASIEDVPLPPGFVESAAPSNFDSAEGRLVLAFAEGDLSTLAVRNFYHEALPPLGWSVSPRPDGVLVFQRGREELSFTIERRDGRTSLGARLVVAPAAMDAD